MTTRTKVLLLPLTVLSFTLLTGCKDTEKGPVTTIDHTENSTYQEGPWAYIVTVNSRSSNNQGVVGRLYYQGVLVPVPENLGDYYETTLGKFHYVGVTPGTEQNPILPWDDQGWIQLKPGSKALGQKLSLPTATTNGIESQEPVEPTAFDDPNTSTESM